MPLNLPLQDPALPWTLHLATLNGSTELVLALLSRGMVDNIDLRIDGGCTAAMLAVYENHHRVVEVLLQHGAGVDHRNDRGFTSLIIAADRGHHRVVKILLEHGANVSSATNDGLTALLASARNGYPVVTAMLVRAGANLEVMDRQGCSPLHLAANNGYIAVVRLLAEAGANPDTYLPNGEGPLYDAAFGGRVEVVKLLLSLGVHPARPVVQRSHGETRVPLDAAAEFGHRETVRELLQLGLEVCGGARLGTDAIVLAAEKQHFDVVTLLRDAGAADTEGVALFTAADNGHEEVVRFLLRQKWATPGGTYVNNHNSCGVTALSLSVGAASPRIARMLLDAGADETKTSRLMIWFGGVDLGTPLELTLDCLAHKKLLGGQPATEDQLHRLEAIRRLLLRVEAVRAASWLWPRKAPFITHVVLGERDEVAAKAKASPRVLMVRRKTGVRLALLKSVFRQSRKP